jgi:hypothetical protein
LPTEQRGLPTDGFEAGTIIGIMDDLLVQLVLWLQGKLESELRGTRAIFAQRMREHNTLLSHHTGNSLAQTVFTCVYTHKISVLKDPYLKAFCIAILKLVSHIRDLVLSLWTVSFILSSPHPHSPSSMQLAHARKGD